MPEFEVTTALERTRAEPRGTAATLLRRAEALFAEHGYDGVSTRDVAAAAGVNVSTLHFHWRDKATLYEAVARDQDRCVLEFFQRLGDGATRKRLSRAQEVDRWVEWSFDFMAEHPAAARFGLRELLEGRARPAEVRREAAVLRFATDEIRRRLPRRGSRAADPVFVALSVLYAGLVVFSDPRVQQRLLGGSIRRDADLRRRMKDFARTWLLRMLGWA